VCGGRCSAAGGGIGYFSRRRLCPGGAAIDRIGDGNTCIEEGVEFIFNVSPLSINEQGVILEKTELTTADESGRQKVKIINNSSYLQESDVIIMALGFDQELPEFIKNSSLQLDKWNGIKVNDDYTTNIKNVYSGGACVTGADLAVTATLDGRESAKTIIKSFLILK